MNKIILMGNLTKDPESAETPDGTYYVNYSIAVQREYGDEGADFFNCTTFGKSGENLKKWVKKGQRILIEGRVKQTTKEKDGNKRTFWSVITSKWEFAGGKNSSEDPSQDHEPYEEPVERPNTSTKDVAKAPYDDGLPF